MGTLRKLGQMLGLIKKDKQPSKPGIVKQAIEQIKTAHTYAKTSQFRQHTVAGAFGKEKPFEPKYGWGNGCIKFASARKRRCAG